MRRACITQHRRAFTVRDLAVGLTCLLVAAGLLVSLTGATRDLSQTQACADHLRQLFAGLTAYVNQYNSYPPHGPYPTYAPSQDIPGTPLKTGGWDPNIGWILTYGLGYEPPARYPDGHFKWSGAGYDSLPDVCKCPALPPATLDPANPELADYNYDGIYPMESVLYQYALSYQTSGTCRAATTVVQPPRVNAPGIGGRNYPIPDPTGGMSTAWMANNAQRMGPPYVWVLQKKPGTAPDDPADTGSEYACWIQAVSPAEIDNPGRVYYLADSRDYRPQPKGQTYSRDPAGQNAGWRSFWGNRIPLGTRHYSYANVLYLDGRVTREGQTHDARWNMNYDAATGQALSRDWRMATFATDIRTANIRGESPIMPVLSVKGWEAFFGPDGLKAR